MPAPAYELEHIPRTGPTVRQSLAAWGCSHRLRRENWGIDQLQLTDTTDGSPFVAPVFGYLDQVCLWRDGSRLWRGWVTKPAAQATPQSDARPYTILGAGWWLAISPWALGWTGTRTSRTVGNWVSLALQRAIYVGAPIALSETPETDYALSMRAPDLLDSDTCWTVIQRAARYAPNSAGYWDDSGDVSIFRTRERADLTPLSLALGTQVTSVDELAALHESQLHAVRLIYGHWYDGLGGETWETYTRDRAGDNDYAGPANLLEVRVTVDSYDAALTSVGYHIAAKLYAALNPLSWAGQLTCDESVAALPLIRPGQALNITGGNAEWTTMNAVVAAVELSATPEADTCTIQLGPPPPLGPQDFMELFRIAGQAGNSVSGNPTPFPPPTPPTIDPGDDGANDYTDLMDDDSPPAGAVTYSCRTRGGAATIKGFASCVPTTPERRFLTATISGGSAWDRYTDSACTVRDTGMPSGTCTYAGSCTFDPVTDQISCSGIRRCDPTDAEPITAIGCLSPYCGTVVTNTETSSARSLDAGPCCPVGVGDVYYHMTAESTAVALTTEDTEDAAVSRLLASEAGGTWSEWASVSLPGCSSIRTERLSGVTFSYTEAEFRIQANGISGIPFVAIRVHISRTDLDTGVTTLAEVREIVVPISSTIEEVVTLPIEIGYSHSVSKVTWHTILE